MNEQSRKWTRGKWTHDVDLYLYAGPCQIGKVYLGEHDEANATLIAEAGTVANETGLTPRQLAERVETLERILSIIVANSVIQPDAHMSGAADCYAIPIDDIEEARAALRTTNTP